ACNGHSFLCGDKCIPVFLYKPLLGSFKMIDKLFWTFDHRWRHTSAEQKETLERQTAWGSLQDKEKVDLCSTHSGISINSIYPVKNYHTEITQDDGADVLILMALRDIVKTHRLKKHGHRRYPFVFCDIMGLEEDESAGIQTEDIASVLQGHISDGYIFNPLAPITLDNPKYNKDPHPCEKVQCLVSILPADSISRMSDRVIDKMKTIQQKAAQFGIPQVIVMTKVDKACQIVHQDLKKIYHSTKIKEKVKECSNKLGISLNSIYPVKNYHVEISQNPTADNLILMALRDIVNFANDYWRNCMLFEECSGEHKWAKIATGFSYVFTSEKDATLKDLERFRPSANELRILLHGPTGAGKSCFINSVQRILLGHNAIGALEQSTTSGASFTRTIKSHKLKKQGGGRFPFIFSDIMGLEPEDTRGILIEDIIKVLEGHISDGYIFNPLSAIPENDLKYNRSPNLNEKVHCLVSIIPADSISRMSDKVIHKMRTIRQKAALMDIPQVVVLTKVDNACQVVNEDLKKIYHSKKIKDKVEECSNKLGISLNCIYPVKNYHAEITQDADVDALILMALRDIINFANDYVDDVVTSY
ncbi:hypothetical protein NFI96_012705, partial [Prochilodus magdalenae]